MGNIDWTRYLLQFFVLESVSNLEALVQLLDAIEQKFQIKIGIVQSTKYFFI